MENEERLTDIIDYYRVQGAPSDQLMLIALLKEAQELDGGVLKMSTISEIAQVLTVKETVLTALIRRIPALRFEDVPHTLEMCGTCRCSGDIRRYIEDELGMKSGDASKAYGFAYRTVTCMKNCKNGPSIKWDGKLYSHTTVEILKQLIDGKKI